MVQPVKRSVLAYILSFILFAVLLTVALTVFAERINVADDLTAQFCRYSTNIRGDIAGLFVAEHGGFSSGEQVLARTTPFASLIVNMIPLKACRVYQGPIFSDTISFGRWVGKYGTLCWNMYGAGSTKKPLYGAGAGGSGNPALCAVSEYKFDKNYYLKSDTNKLEDDRKYTGYEGIFYSEGQTRNIVDLMSKSVMDYTVSEFLYMNYVYEEKIKNEEQSVEGDIICFQKGDKCVSIAQHDCVLTDGTDSVEMPLAMCLEEDRRVIPFECSVIPLNSDDPNRGSYKCGELEDLHTYSTDYLVASTSQGKILITSNYREGQGGSGLLATVEISRDEFESFISGILENGVEDGVFKTQSFYLDLYFGARYYEKDNKALILPQTVYAGNIGTSQLATKPCSLFAGDFSFHNPATAIEYGAALAAAGAAVAGPWGAAAGFVIGAGASVVGLDDTDNANAICWPQNDDGESACTNDCTPLKLKEGYFKLGYYDWTTPFEEGDLFAGSGIYWDDCSGSVIGANSPALIMQPSDILADANNLIGGVSSVLEGGELINIPSLSGQPEFDFLGACIIEKRWGTLVENGGNSERPIWESGTACEALINYKSEWSKDSSGNKVFGYCGPQCGMSDSESCI